MQLFRSVAQENGITVSDHSLELRSFRRPEVERHPSQDLTPMSFVEQLRAEAIRLGFNSMGICQPCEPQRWDAFVQWLENGFAGTMTYLPDRRQAYRHPNSVLDGCQSLIMLTLNYGQPQSHSQKKGHGKVSQYAWGSHDYHDVIHDQLKTMRQWIHAHHPEAQVRGVVDTAPLLERDFAQLAGVGWIGKHTLLMNRRQGSWFFLAALLTDLELPADPPFAKEYCGSCTACLDVCPTDAFVAPYQLDPRRCISYLTIEHRGPIAAELRPLMGEWVFGCDECQDVCPWNQHSPRTAVTQFDPRPDLNPLNLIELLSLTEQEFRDRFRKTPLWRAQRTGLLRNAAIALGNRPCEDGFSALCLAIDDDAIEIRGAAAWALSRYPADAARPVLENRLADESDLVVIAELEASLGSLSQ